MSDNWTKAAVIIGLPTAILAGIEIYKQIQSDPESPPPAARHAPAPQAKFESDKGAKVPRSTTTGSIKRKPIDEPGVADDIARWWDSLSKPWPKEAMRDPLTRD
jgi:hypothetical protein